MILAVMSRGMKADAIACTVAATATAVTILQKLDTNALHMAKKLDIFICLSQPKVHKIANMSLWNALVVCCASVLATVWENHTEIILVYDSITNHLAVRLILIRLNKLAEGTAISKRCHFGNCIVFVQKRGGFAQTSPTPVPEVCQNFLHLIVKLRPQIN